mgnify:CR=1 FL=1
MTYVCIQEKKVSAIQREAEKIKVDIDKLKAETRCFPLVITSSNFVFWFSID